APEAHQAQPRAASQPAPQAQQVAQPRAASQPAPQAQAAPVVPQQHAAIVEPGAPKQATAPAPVIAAPKSASASGSHPAGKKAKDKKGGKGKFRETLWFKKGELDAQAAQAAAEERARTGRDTGATPADSGPIDERYKDDGTISREDKEKY